MIGRPELTEIYGTREAQIDVRKKEEFDAILTPWLLEHTKKECVERGQAAGELCAPVNTTEDLCHDPHWKGRGFWVEIEHPIAGKLIYPGAVAKMSATPWRVRRPAPLLGQHNKEIYRDLVGYTQEDLVTLREQEAI